MCFKEFANSGWSQDSVMCACRWVAIVVGLSAHLYLTDLTLDDEFDALLTLSQLMAQTKQIQVPDQSLNEQKRRNIVHIFGSLGKHCVFVQ